MIVGDASGADLENWESVLKDCRGGSRLARLIFIGSDKREISGVHWASRLGRLRLLLLVGGKC